MGRKRNRVHSNGKADDPWLDAWNRKARQETRLRELVVRLLSAMAHRASHPEVQAALRSLVPGRVYEPGYLFGKGQKSIIEIFEDSLGHHFFALEQLARSGNWSGVEHLSYSAERLTRNFHELRSAIPKMYWHIVQHADILPVIKAANPSLDRSKDKEFDRRFASQCEVLRGNLDDSLGRLAHHWLTGLQLFQEHLVKTIGRDVLDHGASLASNDGKVHEGVIFFIHVFNLKRVWTTPATTVLTSKPTWAAFPQVADRAHQRRRRRWGAPRLWRPARATSDVS